MLVYLRELKALVLQTVSFYSQVFLWLFQN